jgi:hypothetical protein
VRILRSAWVARLAALVLLVSGLSLSKHRADSEAATLEVPDGAYGWTAELPVGERFMDGYHVVKNMGDVPVKIIRVTSELTGRTLREEGARVALLDRGYVAWQYLPSWPPREPKLGTVVPAEGAVLRPGHKASTYGYELLLGYEVIGKGRSTRKSVTVEYEVGGRRYKQTYVATLAICSPKPYKPGCADEYAGTF